MFGNKKIAIVTESPKHVMIPVLVEANDDGYFSKPFFTMEVRVSWVLT